MTAPRIPTCVYNEAHGHGAILRTACGVRGFVPIRGRVQHGWSPIAGGMAVDSLTATGEPMFFWTDRARDEFLTEHPDYPRATVIGAPFLYMPVPPIPPVRDRTLLAFPFHGTVEHPLADGAWSLYASALVGLGRRLGVSTTVVCLYDLEWREGPARPVLEAAGLGTTTLRLPITVDYLVRFRALVGRAAAVVASRPCTALFYAMAMACPAMVQPDGLRFAEPDRYEATTADETWCQTRFPALYRGEPVRDETMWRTELGADNVLPPDRLFKALYGWTEMN